MTICLLGTKQVYGCPHILAGVCIKRVEFRENARAFHTDKENCPQRRGVLIKRVSVK